MDRTRAKLGLVVVVLGIGAAAVIADPPLPKPAQIDLITAYEAHELQGF